MHVAYVSAQTAERRRQKVEDVKKRAEYRKAHGQGQNEGVLGGWTARDDGEALGPALREGGAIADGRDGAVVVGPGFDRKVEMDVARVAEEADAKGEEFVDFEGKRRPVVKKWFGIW